VLRTKERELISESIIKTISIKIGLYLNGGNVV